jgi:hypothetical protein
MINSLNNKAKIFKRIFIPVIFLFLTFLASGCFAMRFIGNPGSSVLRIRGVNLSDVNFDTALQTIQTVLEPGSTEGATIQDLDATIRINPTILTEGQVGISVINNIFSYSPITFTSLDTDIATINSYGQVTRVSNGTARILAGNPFLKKRIDVPVSISTESPVTTYNNFIAGTLGKNVSDNIDDRITEVTSENASTYKPIFSTQDHTNSIYIRNTDSWIYGLDLTPISPWNSNSGVYKAGTLISPRHIIFANHYTIANGSTIRFVTSDNVVVERTLVNSISVTRDIRVGVLNSDVPETITFAKFLPDGWQDYIPGISHIGVPCFYTDQQEKALINILNDTYAGEELISFSVPTDDFSHRLALYENLVSGDSGNPGFLIINDQLVILTTWWFGFAGTGPNLTHYKDEINSTMTTLGGGYQVTEADLSGFTSF